MDLDHIICRMQNIVREKGIDQSLEHFLIFYEYRFKRFSYQKSSTMPTNAFNYKHQKSYLFSKKLMALVQITK